MESEHINNSETGEKPTVEIKHQIIPATDNILIKENIVQKKELIPINLEKMQKTPIKPEDVVQFKIGNCFFLSALASILETHPDYINNILKVNNDGLVEVTLHDVRNPNQVFTYILDPTKVLSQNKSNNHTHDAIFLIEKAYAFHRIRTEPLKYTERELVVRDALKQANNNREVALQKLLSLKQERIHEDEQNLLKKIELIAVEQKAVTKDDEHLLNKLVEKNFNVKTVFEEECKKMHKEISDFMNIEIVRMIKKMTTERLDYISALDAGYSTDAYRALLGVNTDRFVINQDDTFHYFLMNFIKDIKMLPFKEYDQRMIQTLTTMFGDPESEEAKYFIESVKNTDLYLPGPPEETESKGEEDVKEAQELKKKPQPIPEGKPFTWPDLFLEMYDKASPKKPKKHELLANFMNMINWQPDNSHGLKEKTMMKVLAFINKEIPHKRGTKKYTHQQQQLYEKIYNSLKEGQLVSIGTRSIISRDRDGTLTKQASVKGLYTEHAYQVVNCYERDGIKYIGLRNPHGKDVRDYGFKTTAEGQTLTAMAKTQLFESNFIKAFGMSISNLLHSRPRDNPIEDPAIPLPKKQFDNSGYFEIELNELTKAFEEVIIAKMEPAEKAKPSNRKNN